MQVQTPFVIFFLERSGSSHLCSLLDSHPQISCGAEEFTFTKAGTDGQVPAVRLIHARKVRITDPTRQQVVDHLRSIFSRSAQAAGFKFKYPLQVQRFPEVYQQLVDWRSSVRIIHLDRTNVLRKAVSRQILEHQRQDPAFRPDRARKLFKPVPVDIEALLGQMQRSRQQRRELRQLLEPFGHCLTVEYDDLHRRESEVQKRLQEFLAVDEGHRLQSRFQKVAPERLRDAISNYRDVVAAIRETEFESLLGDDE